MKNKIILLIELLALTLIFTNYSIASEDDDITIEAIIPNYGPSKGGTDILIIGKNLDKIKKIILGDDIVIDKISRTNNNIEIKTKELPFVIINPLSLKLKFIVEKEGASKIILTEKEFTYIPVPNFFDLDFGIIFIPTMETIGYPGLIYSVNPFAKRFNYVIPPKNLRDFKNSFSISFGFIWRKAWRYPYNATATRLIKQDIVPLFGFGYKFSNWGRLIFGTSIFTRTDKSGTQLEYYFGISFVDWSFPLIWKRTKAIYEYVKEGVSQIERSEG